MSERFRRGVMLLAIILMAVNAGGVLALAMIAVRKQPEIDQQVKDNTDAIAALKMESLKKDLMLYSMEQREDPMNIGLWRSMYLGTLKEIERRNANQSTQ